MRRGAFLQADRIIGVWRDENAVEYVRVYRLTRKL